MAYVDFMKEIDKTSTKAASSSSTTVDEKISNETTGGSLREEYKRKRDEQKKIINEINSQIDTLKDEIKEIEDKLTKIDSALKQIKSINEQISTCKRNLDNCSQKMSTIRIIKNVSFDNGEFGKESSKLGKINFSGLINQLRLLKQDLELFRRDKNMSISSLKNQITYHQAEYDKYNKKYNSCTLR